MTEVALPGVRVDGYRLSVDLLSEAWVGIQQDNRGLCEAYEGLGHRP